MLALLGISTIASLIGCSVIGVRLLLLYRRSRQLPELIMGSSFLVGGVIGYIFMLLGTGGAQAMGEDLAKLFFLVGYALISAAVILTYLFVWRVFRSGARWAACLFFACTGVLLLGGVGLAITLVPGDSISRPTGVAAVWLTVSLVARLVGYGWAAIESFRYWSMLKRRVAIGLADVATANRFYYWGVCTAAVVCIWFNLLAEQFVPWLVENPALSQMLSAVLGFVVAGSLWIAFFPGSTSAEATAVGAE